MSQKREKEVTELKVPETVPMCTPLPPISAPPSQSTIARPPDASDPEVSAASSARTSSDSLPGGPDLEPRPRSGTKRPREVNRCSGSGCRKRIGLMGFRCRCGDVFCSQHRYSDRHDCSYDYKAAGREAIARDNPVIRATKLFRV